MPHNFYRDFSRRDVLKMGLASALGLSYSGWLEAMARGAAVRRSPKSCILLWMNGGPSQIDTFDPKPGTSTGGPFEAIETSAPGLRVSEHLPMLAQHGRHLGIVRGMTSQEGDHGRATYLVRTGYRPQGSVRYPTLGSLVSKELGRADADLPNYVSVSPFQFFNRAAYSPGFLGPTFSPLNVASRTSFQPDADDSLTVDDLAPAAGLEPEVVRNRVDLLGFVQSEFARRHRLPSVDAHQANSARAARMVLSKVESVFDLNQEPAALRDAYGRNRFGQGCLLARRLVERGVPFVEIALASIPGSPIGWDTHQGNFEQVRRLLGILDPAWATLMTDLEARGLLDSTLIVWMGEFGRTPFINGSNGRDHFPAAWSAVLAGGGIQGGQAIGDTGEKGIAVVDRPVSVPNLMATICATLGIDYKRENISDEDRPIPFVDRGAAPVTELVS